MRLGNKATDYIICYIKKPSSSYSNTSPRPFKMRSGLNVLIVTGFEPRNLLKTLMINFVSISSKSFRFISFLVEKKSCIIRRINNISKSTVPVSLINKT